MFEMLRVKMATMTLTDNIIYLAPQLAPTTGSDFIHYNLVDPTVVSISQPLRWVIFIIGVLETFLFGGCIFGWAPFVFILKNEAIFFDLCQNSNNSNSDNSSFLNFDEGNTEANTVHDILKTEGCEEQDKIFALLYTIGSLSYSCPSILMGLMLHHWGLAASRIISSSLLSLGFLALAYTTKENTIWLYFSVVFMAVGGNFLRLCGLQFCNLFPNYRSTALGIISGCFAASPGLFVFLQIGQQCGLSLWSMGLFLAGVAFISLPATLLMPRDEIPHRKLVTSPSSDTVPLRNSLFSISAGTHFLWMFLGLCSIKFFTMNYNSWVNKISQSTEEAGRYSLYFSCTSFIGPFISFIPGLLTDWFSKRSLKDTSLESRAKNELRSPVPSLILGTVLAVVLQCFSFFKEEMSVYFSLGISTLLRPTTIAVTSIFLRVRFPASHFSRILGILETVISVFSIVLYPFFIWSQDNFFAAVLFFIILLSFSLVHPLHLLSNAHFKRISASLSLQYEIEKFSQ